MVDETKRPVQLDQACMQLLCGTDEEKPHDLDWLLDRAGLIASIAILDRKDTAHFQPLYVMVDPTGERHIRPVLFRNEHELQAELAAAARSMRHVEAVAYALVMMGSPEPEDAAMPPDPSRSLVDRRNTIIAVATNGSDTKYAQWTLRRDSDGTITALDRCEIVTEKPPVFEASQRAFMTDEELSDLVRFCFEYASKKIIDQRDELKPTFVLIGPTGEREIVETPFHNLEEKFLIAETMRARMRKSGTIAHAFISEN